MRPEPPLSVRQSRLLKARPEVLTPRQRTVVLSDRMVRGFKRNARRIAARQGIPYDRASAILASASRRASSGAKRRNPRLRKVKGG